MEIRDYLQTNIQPGQKIAVLGIGSTLRSDDAAGMYFIELLGNLVKKENVLLIAGSTAPENFTGVIKSFAPDTLFIVDAAYIGLLPGEAKVVSAADISGVSFSTHMLPLPVMLKYLEAEVHCDVIFIGIQPKCTEQGLIMSDEVKKGTERLVEDFYHAFLEADG
jgi:hydrogenase 3 maturation protease